MQLLLFFFKMEENAQVHVIMTFMFYLDEVLPHSTYRPTLISLSILALRVLVVVDDNVFIVARKRCMH